MKTGEYEFEILVHGKPVAEYAHKGETFIEGKKDTEFSLRLRNNTSERALFVPTIDGLSVMDGKEASFKSQGYIVDRHTTETIDGWRTSDAEVAKFFFAAVSESYAALSGKAGNVGVIGCAVFMEKRTQPYVIHTTPPYHQCNNWPHCNGCHCWVCQQLHGTVTIFNTTSGGTSGSINTQTGGVVYTASGSASVSALSANAAQGGNLMQNLSVSSASNSAPAIGTGFGESKYSPVHTVSFDRHASPAKVFEVRYNTRSNLEAMGVEFKKAQFVSPSAFPKQDRYCQPPRE